MAGLGLSMSDDFTPAGSGAEVVPGVVLPRSALQFHYSRSSGPGGQHVNKVASRVQLRVSMSSLEPIIGPEALRRLARLAGSRLTANGDLLLVAGTSRSQHANRRACLDRLGALLKEAVRRPRLRRRSRPSTAVKQCRLDAKRHRARIKAGRKPPRDEC